MFLALVRFYCTRAARFFLPREAEICLPDASDSHRRRYSRSYRIKRGWVKKLWIAASLLMLCFPLLPFIVATGLFTAFLSFAILDETT